MKFTPRDIGQAAEVSSGGGNRGMFRELAILTVLVVVALTMIYGLIAMGTDFVISRISFEREAKLFALMDQTMQTSEVPESYLEKWSLAQSILDKLEEYPDTPPMDFRLSYIVDPQPNAFAFPGGTIVVTSGLLDSLDEEVSFAFVLAHEIGHFAHRDHLRGFGRRLGLSAALALLFGGQPDPWVKHGAELMMLHYSRIQESRADDFALKSIDHLYGTRDGAERLFEVLEERGEQLPGWAYMFNSHPDNKKRIEKILESRLQNR